MAKAPTTHRANSVADFDGPAKRAALTGQLVTVIGGGGFVGKYVAQKLLSAGARVRIAERNPRKAFAIRPLGGLGQTQFVAADITDAASITRAVRGSDAVVNLVGVFAGDLHAIHVAGARDAAAVAKAQGAAFVHISAIGADAGAESRYARTKGEGEAAVRTAHPGATILRPSIVFGPEDDFINRFAGLIRMLPVVPVIGAATRFQPVYVGDVADAVLASLAAPAQHCGQTYDLGGPEILTMRALNEKIATATGRKREFIDVPGFASRLLAKATGWAPGAPITFDQWLMLQHDTVVASDAQALAALGVTPTPLDVVARGWLVKYRRHGRFGGRAAS